MYEKREDNGLKRQGLCGRESQEYPSPETDCFIKANKTKDKINLHTVNTYMYRNLFLFKKVQRCDDQEHWALAYWQTDVSLHCHKRHML
uniref:Uncharacterized protein n=1 Tax=Pyxicephalus adspersus TaxID=30357 RepID=A0AAV3ATM9_PYXAD|nr:TPA: hypothetical protein GDO54_010316 [Pyxicephalus adspersus]